MLHIVVTEGNHLAIEPRVHFAILAKEVKGAVIDRLEVEDFVVTILLTDGHTIQKDLSIEGLILQEQIGFQNPMIVISPQILEGRHGTDPASVRSENFLPVARYEDVVPRINLLRRNGILTQHDR